MFKNLKSSLLIFISATIGLVLITGNVRVVFADEPIQPTPVSDDDVNAIAKEIICPICNNVTLDVCDTQACAQWRQLIKDKLSEGWSAKEIKVYLAELYGDKVLTEPPLRDGISLNWLIYIVPLVIILISFAMGIKYISSHLKKETR